MTDLNQALLQANESKERRTAENHRLRFDFEELQDQKNSRDALVADLERQVAEALKSK